MKRFVIIGALVLITCVIFGQLYAQQWQWSVNIIAHDEGSPPAQSDVVCEIPIPSTVEKCTFHITVSASKPEAAGYELVVEQAYAPNEEKTWSMPTAAGLYLYTFTFDQDNICEDTIFQPECPTNMSFRASIRKITDHSDEKAVEIDTINHTLAGHMPYCGH